MKEFIQSLFIFFTTLMWVDLILCFFSKELNESIIESLKNQNKRIDKQRESIKKLFINHFKK